MNLKLFLIIDNVMNVIEIPDGYNSMLYESNCWDIGFILPKSNQFVEINALCQTVIPLSLKTIKPFYSLLGIRLIWISSLF